MDHLRRHVIHVLTQFDKTGSQLKQIRNNYCNKHNITSSDRHRLTELSNDIIRWRGRIDYWLNSILNQPQKKLQPELKNIFRAGIYENVIDDRTPSYAAVSVYVEIAKSMLGAVPGKLTNAILRKATAIDPNNFPGDSSLHSWYSLPQWLWNKWNKQFGKENTVTLAEHFNAAPKFDIRINNSVLARDGLLAYCATHDVGIEDWRCSDLFYRVKHNFAGLRSFINEGKIKVQDRAAGKVVELLDPQAGETILDVCAAPGTKTAYIAELLDGKGQLFISDSNKERMQLYESVFNNVSVEVKDATKDEYPQADAILIDAPCSGTGVIGKKPDIRWRRKPNQIANFVKLQKSILNHIGQFVKPGGRIIYSTCSLEPEENWGVVDAFLKLNANYFIDMETKDMPISWRDKRGALATFPPESKTDGMFAVCLTHGPE